VVQQVQAAGAAADLVHIRKLCVQQGGAGVGGWVVCRGRHCRRSNTTPQNTKHNTLGTPVPPPPHPLPGAPAGWG
jgi:hypothetical protein